MAAGVDAAQVGPGIHELVVLANLVVVFLIVYFGAGKGILGALKSRAAKGDLKDFDNTRNRIIAEMRSEAEHVSRGILEEATVTAERILQDAKLSAKDEARGAAADLKNELVKSALAETQRLLAQGKDQQSSLHKQLFEGLNNDIKGAAHGR
jgi:F0F1-type ATP synthase membrane subunit b/b'